MNKILKHNTNNYHIVPTLLKIALAVLLFSGCAVSKPFQLVLLPDTQVYSERFPEVFDAQTQWIARNADSITFVLHQGDITNRNTDEQWQNAANAIKYLEGKVPFTFVGGNHDLGETGSANTRDSELMNKHLPYNKYSKFKEFGGAYETGKMDNTWYTFKAGGLKWLILSLEFGPRNKILDWAGKIIEQHPSHKIIINTHAYMFSDNTRISIGRGHSWVPQNYGVGKMTGEDTTNDGEMMWEKLVSQYPNIIMVVSGHVLNSGTGRLISQGKYGNKVYQMLGNYQMGEKGGNGFLRILLIDTKKQKISVRAYSPFVNQNNINPEHQFEFNDVKF